MKQIISILAVVFALTSATVHAQTSFISDVNKAVFSKHIQFVNVNESVLNYQMFEPIMFPALISQENISGGILNGFSKGLPSELSSGKWDNILQEKSTDYNFKAPIFISLLKTSNPDKISLFGNPLRGFTDQKLVFNEPVLFGNTLLVYSF